MFQILVAYVASAWVIQGTGDVGNAQEVRVPFITQARATQAKYSKDDFSLGYTVYRGGGGGGGLYCMNMQRLLG